MPISRLLKTVLPLFLLFFFSPLSAQIWVENFNGANQGWTDNFTDCDGTGTAMVNNGRFEVNDMEGSPCCPGATGIGGGNNNEWVTNDINIQGYCNVSISVQYGIVGTFECNAGGPFFACTGTDIIDNGHDQMVFQYSLDGGAWVQFLYVCGGQFGTATIGGLNGNTLRIRIMPANKSNAEVYWFDNVTVDGFASPTVNPPADVTACAGANVTASFTGTSSPVFHWVNNNTAIGLGASGTGNINFTAANVTTPTTATVTVTPVAGGCTGVPDSFEILINPVPTVNQPPNISVCSGDMVDIMFSGSSSTATYNWTANIPFFQPSGQGNITGTVPPLPFPITGSITVTPTENGCPGMPKTFTVSAYPAPSADMTLTNGPLFCAGQNANFSVNFTNGNAPYIFTYALNGVNQPPVTTNSDPYNFSLTVMADVTVSAVSVTTGVGCTVNATGSFPVDVTPTPTATLTGGTSTICQGQMLDLTINFNGTDTYTFVYSLNNVNQPPVTTQGPAYTLSVEPPLGTSTYRLVSVSSNGCTGTATGVYTVTNIPSPVASIAGSPTVCAGQPATVTVTLSGAAPYTFIYSLNGVDQPSVTTSTSSYNITGTYLATTVIELESVSSGTCTGNTSGTATVTVNPAPTASFQTASTVVCSGQPANINVAFTGNAPFTFIYSVGGNNQPAVTTSANPYVLTVSPPATTTYTLVSVVSGTCVGTATGSHTVSIGSSLEVVLSADTTICSGRSAPLTFTFTGPTPPYTIEYTANLVPQPALTATSNPFIFNVSPTETTAYEITAATAGSCQGTFSGLGLVIVDPSASAVLESGNDTICSGTKDTLLVTFTGAPGPYSFVYALNGHVVDTITTTGLDTFYHLPLMPPVGRDTFTLLNISSPACANGAVSGQYIYWVKPTPVTDLQGDVSVCLGNEGSLVFNFSGDTVWTANYTADGIPQPPLVTTQDPDTIKVTPTATTTFILTDVTSSNGCTFSQPDTVVMAVNAGATATIDPVEVAFCAGGSDTTLVTLGGGAPYTLVYSVNGVLQPPVLTNGPTYSIIRTPASGTTEMIRLVSVNSPGCNGSTVSGIRTITAKPVPTANFQTDSSVICGASNARIVVDFTGGGGPWVLEYTIDGLQQFPLTTVKDPDTLNVFVQQNTVFGITSVSLDGCTNATADQHVVTVADSLKAILSGGGQVCGNGTGADLRVDFVGQGPYTFTYQYIEMGMNKQVTVTTAQNPYIFHLNPSTGKVYTLASVNNGICNGSVSGVAVIFVFTPSTADMSGSEVFCDSAVTNIKIDFTGTGPFAITYTIDGISVGPDTTFEDPYLIPVNVKQTTNFVLTGVQSPGCVGTVSGNATLTVNYSPKPSNLSVACNPTLGTYVVTFNTTGTPPFVLQAGAGTFTGNTFTSSPIPVGSPYTITYRDAGNCSPATLTGLEDCTCQTDAGNMSQSTETVCQDQPVSVPTSLGFDLDNNDTLIYILHTNPGLPLGQIFASNAVPTFTFQPGMQTEVTYYISAMAGDRLANGFVDTADLCLSVATGTPVVFHRFPTGMLLPVDTVICANEPVELTINFSGTGPFSYRLDSSGVLLPVVTNVMDNPHSFFINPLVTTLIVLDSIGDNFCPSIAASGQAGIEIQKPPVAVGVEVICDYVDATFIVKFTASGGIAPYDIINGNLTGTFMDSLFQSDPLPWGTPFFGILNDALQCGVDTISGTGNCACITDAGSMNALQLVSLCAGDSTMLAYNNDAVLDGNDVQRFMLHTLPDTVAGTVLAVNSTSRFGFDPNTMVLGVTYYVSSIAGNFDGLNGVDTTDICFDMSPGTPVVWTAGPTATMSDTFDVCPGVQLLIPVALTGQAPFMFTYTNNGTPVNVSPLSTNFGILATLQTSATYIPISIKDANGCTGTVSGQAVVNVHQAPDIINVKVTCSPDNLTYVLEFDVTKAALGPGSVSITGNVTGTYNDATGHFTSDPIARTTDYALTVTDIKYNCGIDNISGKSNCPCPTKAGSMPQTPLTLCVGAPANAQPVTGTVLEPGDTLVYALSTGNPSQPGTWVVLATSATPQFAYNPLTMVPGTTYLIVAVAANTSPVPPGVDLSDPCLSVASGPTVTWRVAPTAVITGDASICAGKSATLTITFTGTGPFTYTYTDGSLPQTLISNGNTTTINVTPGTTTTYTLTNVSGAGDCPGTVSGSATITIRTPPTATLNGNFTLCAGENVNFPVAFTGTAPFQFVYAIDGVAQPPLSSPSSSFFLSVNDLQAPHVITLISVQDASCTGTVSGEVNITVNQPPTAGLSGSTTICAGDSATLTLNLTGASAFDVTISGGLQPIQLTGVSTGAKLTVTPTATTTYLITAVTPSGNSCTPTITTDATVMVTTLSATANVSNYSGFGVSCPGQQDGSITINPIGGTPPFTAQWSPAGSGLQLSNLDTGTYTVLLTDLTGCTLRDTFTLQAPTGITLDFEVVSPVCFGQTNGILSITGITGGSGPYSLTINDTLAQLGPSLPAVYAPLQPGDYVLVLTDANGCETEETAIIVMPPALMLDLGPDITLALGDSTLLKFETNAVLLDTFIWSPTQFLRTPHLEKTWALPPETQEYTLSIRDTLGCVAEDRILVTVNDLGRIYVPNAIYPDSYTFNDVVTVYAGSEVEKVLSFRIFDRWGSQVYEDKDFLPNQERRGWNGRDKGKDVNPGVFVYVAEVLYFNGRREIVKGDVTVVR